jgi:ABC-type multidrug transport system ATPase subunit
MSIVGLQQVCKKFGPVFAGEKVSFQVNEGELLRLLGPNGVGKTTFIRLVLDNFQVKRFEI